MWGKKNSVGKEDVAKLVDGIYRYRTALIVSTLSNRREGFFYRALSRNKLVLLLHVKIPFASVDMILFNSFCLR